MFLFVVVVVVVQKKESKILDATFPASDFGGLSLASNFNHRKKRILEL
jgi:hypothetical protein